MTLATPEFIRRFLIHVLPAGFHRIRHYGLFANPVRAKQLPRLRELLANHSTDAVAPTPAVVENDPTISTYICPDCGAPMIIIETFVKQIPRAPPAWTHERCFPPHGILHCRPRTGSATLLPNLGNPPTSSSLMSLQPTHVLKLRSRIKARDPHCNCHPRARRGIDSSNPHSAVATERDRCRHDPAVSSPEYYPTPALDVRPSDKPLLDGRRRIILNMSSYQQKDYPGVEGGSIMVNINARIPSSPITAITACTFEFSVTTQIIEYVIMKSDQPIPR